MKRILNLLLILGAGLFIYSSCGKPTDPESIYPSSSGGYKIVSKFETAAYAQDLIIMDTLCFISQGEGGLMVVDISDREHPETVNIITNNVRGYSTKLAIKDNALYIAAGSFGVTVLNIVKPLTPVVTVSNLSMKPAKNFHVFGEYLITAVSEQGCYFSDVSFPIYPDLRAEFKTPGYAKGLTTNSDSSYLFVATGEMGLTIYNISVMNGGYGPYPQVGWGDTPGYAEAVAVADGNSYAYLACGNAGLQIVDYSDTTNLSIAGTFNGGGYAHEIMLKDDKVYLTTEDNGLQVIDISDVSNPVRIGSVDTDEALGLDMDENYIYIADEEEGLIIIQKPE
jgi:hypothetical protein